MKMYPKTMKHHRKNAFRKAIKHAERRMVRLFCRRWQRGQEEE